MLTQSESGNMRTSFGSFRLRSFGLAPSREALLLCPIMRTRFQFVVRLKTFVFTAVGTLLSVRFNRTRFANRLPLLRRRWRLAKRVRGTCDIWIKLLLVPDSIVLFPAYGEQVVDTASDEIVIDSGNVHTVRFPDPVLQRAHSW